MPQNNTPQYINGNTQPNSGLSPFLPDFKLPSAFDNPQGGPVQGPTQLNFANSPPQFNFDSTGTIGSGAGGTGYNVADYATSGINQGYGSGGFGMGGGEAAAPGIWQQALDGKFGSLAGWGQFGAGVGSLAQAYLGYKGLGLANEQFDYQKAYANRNLSNQAITANAQLDSYRRARGVSGKAVDGSPIVV